MILALVTLALAAEPTPTPVTQIDFEELEVKAPRNGGPITLVAERRQAQFPPMFKLRTSFDDKVKATVAEVK